MNGRYITHYINAENISTAAGRRRPFGEPAHRYPAAASSVFLHTNIHILYYIAIILVRIDSRGNQSSNFGAASVSLKKCSKMVSYKNVCSDYREGMPARHVGGMESVGEES